MSFFKKLFLQTLIKFNPIRTLLQKMYIRFFNFPKIIQLFITNKCNLNCVYCYADISNDTHMSLSEGKNIILQAKRMKTKIITFTGGEPFLNPNFKELLKYTAELNLKIEILTNGTLLTEDWINFLKKINKKVPLSIVFKFSHDKNTYKFHTKKDKYYKVLNNIEKCVANGLNTFTFYVLTKSEFPHIDEILKKSEKLGAWPIFQRYIPVAEPSINKSLNIKAEQYHNALIKYRNFYQKNKSKYGNYSYISAQLRGSICACYRDMIAITVKGEILPCPVAPSDLSIGNIKKIKLRKAWRIYREKQKEWLKLPSKCLSCNLKDMCGGGCLSHKYRLQEKFDIEDPLCIHQNEISTVEGLSAPCRKHEKS